MSRNIVAAHSREPDLDEIIARYPDVPPLIITKIDVQRRGVHYTERALQIMDDARHQRRSAALFGARDGKVTPVPESLVFRDGTTVLTDPTPLEENPYHVDVVDGLLVITDQGKVIEEVEYWPVPDYFTKQTSAGTPMKFVVTARPQRLEISPSSYCHFWNNDKGCKYCDIVNYFKQEKSELGVPAKLNFTDITETIGEALKQPGRFSTICMTAGSDTRGAEPFDNEVDYYVNLLQAIGKNFTTRKFPSQLISTALTEKQLRRLYEETGLMSYTSDIEVLNEKLFNWICPGKAEWIGYKEWQQRLIRAVDIFGRGNVNTGIVGGVELAQPHGFGSEDEALQRTLEEAEYLASHGVSTVLMVWVVRPKSFFSDQKNASLDYYVRLARGLQGLRLKYDLSMDFDDYRRCGNHADSDLLRLV